MAPAERPSWTVSLAQPLLGCRASIPLRNKNANQLNASEEYAKGVS